MDYGGNKYMYKNNPAKISAMRPHLFEILDYIRTSLHPVFRRDIHNDLPHIPGNNLNNDLRFACDHMFCDHKRKFDEQLNKGLVVAYGPLLFEGERFIEAMNGYYIKNPRKRV